MVKVLHNSDRPIQVGKKRLGGRLHNITVPVNLWLSGVEWGRGSRSRLLKILLVPCLVDSYCTYGRHESITGEYRLRQKCNRGRYKRAGLTTVYEKIYLSIEQYKFFTACKIGQSYS